jgi:putative endonuclease
LKQYAGMEHRYWVYMLASRKNGTLYIGVTSDLSRRTFEHKTGGGSTFTSRYGVMRLVWYEEYQYVRDAIAREKSLKRWERSWKIRLFEEMNPDWHDLYLDLNK